MAVHPVLAQTLQAVQARSQATRSAYLARISAAHEEKNRGIPGMGCTNLAHAWAALPKDERTIIRTQKVSAHIGIVSAYNDMLSAHQPFSSYPEQLRAALSHHSATAQVAGGVPAMCDGVTQGTPGMELSLFSRDVIAQSTAVALSHSVFDGAVMLGVCDKIVPGLLMGALAFGHLPTLFLPAGPMPSGLSNAEKAATRKAYAEGKATDEDLMASEQASYHSPGTCTFYGTANTNQLLLETLGVQLPGCAFPNPGTAEREAYIQATAEQIVAMTRLDQRRPIGEIINEAAIINAVVMLLASGGSTNHTIHLIAIARVAGIILTWEDMHALSQVVPTLTRLYPNGSADFNALAQNGGSAFLIQTLRDHGFLIDDQLNAMGHGLAPYCQQSQLKPGDNHQPPSLDFVPIPEDATINDTIVRPADNPFRDEGGLKCVTGNLGQAIIKTSALPPINKPMLLPAVVFTSQQDVITAFNNNKLNQNCAVVVTHQGPKANGMPELHKLMPILGVLQSKGHQVALITDGRLSGASGQVPAAIHVSPEAARGGAIGNIQTGDHIELDLANSTLHWQINSTSTPSATTTQVSNQFGYGRELFNTNRQQVSSANTGAISLFSVDNNGEKQWRDIQ